MRHKELHKITLDDINELIENSIPEGKFIDYKEVLSIAKENEKKEFLYDTLRLSVDKIRDLSQTLVEFAEDVHNDIGIWDSLEQYNLEFFGTKLPLIPGSDEEAADQDSINKRRLQYLLWNQYQLFDPELILSPSHQDLVRLSKMVSDFLSDRFKNQPLGSGIKTFFNQPNEFGWDIKRQLIWF
jgi:hypothetical protein